MIKVSKEEASSAFGKDCGWNSKCWDESGHAQYMLIEKHLEEETKRLKTPIVDMDKNGNYFLRKKKPGEKTYNHFGPACLKAKIVIC